MLRSLNQFSNHGLDNANVPIERSSQYSSKESHPEIGCKSHEEKGKHGAKTPGEKDRFAANTIRKATPEHTSDGFREREGRNEDSGIEGSVVAIRHFVILDHHP